MQFGDEPIFSVIWHRLIQGMTAEKKGISPAIYLQMQSILKYIAKHLKRNGQLS